MSHKRELTPEEKKKTEFLYMRKVSVKALAKHFKTTKPVILKALGLWESEVKNIPDKAIFKVVRGKMVMIKDFVAEKREKEQFEQGLIKLREMLDKEEGPKTDRYIQIEDRKYYIDKTGEPKIMIVQTLFDWYVKKYGQEFADKYFLQEK